MKTKLALSSNATRMLAVTERLASISKKSALALAGVTSIRIGITPVEQSFFIELESLGRVKVERFIKHRTMSHLWPVTAVVRLVPA